MAAISDFASYQKVMKRVYLKSLLISKLPVPLPINISYIFI